jgi:tRNA (guanine37-N1)-methyltransferase
MKVEIVTIFPRMFDQIFHFGMINQASRKGLLEISVLDLRDFSSDRHRTVDDRPYGGGQGMVLKPEPVFRAVEQSLRRDQSPAHVVLLSPQGDRFDQEKAKELSLKTRLILICGRYEGVDQRVADYLVDEELSIGDFVLSGGEFAAAVAVDAVSRLIPGVLGEGESVLYESFMEGLLDYPQYTRPEEFRGKKVPSVLLSGNHSEIRKWREEQARANTRIRRPDLLESVSKGVER